MSQEIEIKNKDQEPGKCNFWLFKKRRFCNISSISKSNYCAEHTLFDENGCLLRTICPFTKSHTVDINDYHAHLFKCPMRPKYPRCYSENFNAGLPHPSRNNPKFHFKPEMVVEFLEIQTKINMIFGDIKNSFALKNQIFKHWSLDERMAAISNSVSAKKHAEQQASLIGHMENLGLIRNDVNYMEFGCGSGEMTKYVFLAASKNPAMTILIDRKQIKLKLDQDFKSTPYQRLIIDIKHLELSRVEHSLRRNAVVYSKHLCGCATDLTIRCLENFRNSGG